MLLRWSDKIVATELYFFSLEFLEWLHDLESIKIGLVYNKLYKIKSLLLYPSVTM